MRANLIRAFLILLATESTAYALEANLVTPSVISGNVKFEGRLFQVPTSAKQFYLGEKGSKEIVSLKGEVLPVELWILVDSSSFCQANRVDSAIVQLIEQLKYRLHPDSVLSVGRYHSQSNELLLHRRRVTELGDFKIECQTQPYSSSYQTPLLNLIEQAQKNKGNLPIVTWVFTAGNVELNAATTKLLGLHNIELDLILYNDFIEKAIRPAVLSTENALGSQMFRFMTANATQPFQIPSLRYRFEGSVPAKWEGRTLTLELSAKGADGNLLTAAQSQVVLSLPMSRPVHFWRAYGGWIIFFTGLLLLGIGIYRAIEFYRPRYCGHCQREIPYYHQVCLKCEGLKHGGLVGDFHLRKAGFGSHYQHEVKNKVLPLLSSKIELGTHRKSPIRFQGLKAKGCLATLIRTWDASGILSFILEPRKEAIRVNGKILKGPRNLASGDRIELGKTQFTFICQQKEIK